MQQNNVCPPPIKIEINSGFHKKYWFKSEQIKFQMPIIRYISKPKIHKNIIQNSFFSLKNYSCYPRMKLQISNL